MKNEKKKKEFKGKVKEAIERWWMVMDNMNTKALSKYQQKKRIKEMYECLMSLLRTTAKEVFGIISRKRKQKKFITKKIKKKIDDKLKAFCEWKKAKKKENESKMKRKYKKIANELKKMIKKEKKIIWRKW